MSSVKKSAIYILITLAIFTLFRLILFFYYKEQFAQISSINIFFAFLDGIRFDLSSFLPYIALSILMINIPLKIFHKKNWESFWSYIIFVFVCLFILILSIDTIYFQYVKRHMGREFLTIFNDLNLIIKIAFKDYAFVIILYALILFIIFKLWQKIVTKPTEYNKSATALILIIIFIILGIRASISRKPISIIDAYNKGTAFGNLVINGLFTVNTAIRKQHNVKTKFYPIEKVYNVLGIKNKQYPLEKQYSETRKKHNVVLIVLESWSKQYIESFGGHHKGITPFFNQLTKKSIKFSNFFASGQRSLDAIQSVLTGIPALPGIPYIGYGFETAKFSQIGNIAKKNNVKSILIQSYRHRSYRMDSIANLCGFNQYYGMEDIPIIYNYENPSSTESGWDYDMLMFLKDKLDNMKNQFLAIAFTGTMHGPFPDIPQKLRIYKTPKTNEEKFINTMHYTDWAIKNFFEKSKKSHWFKNTIFILCADHALVVYENLPFLGKCKIPCIIYAPEIFKPQTNKNIYSQYDLFPTIIDLMGFKDKFYAFGDSIFRKKQNYAIFSQETTVALINPNGYIKHSLNKIIEKKQFGKTSINEKEMEEKLLSSIQLINTLFKNNKLAK